MSNVEEIKQAYRDKLRESERYLVRVIEGDYETTLDELTALVLMTAGPIPPLKPFSEMSKWKGRARAALVQYVMGKEHWETRGSYADIVVLYLARRAGHRLGGSALDGWQREYQRQIKARRNGEWREHESPSS